MLSPRYRFYNMWCDPATIDKYPAIKMLSICICAIKMILTCSGWTIEMLWRCYRCIMRPIKIWHPRPTAMGYWCAIKSLCYPLAIKPPMCALSINWDPHTHTMLSTRNWKIRWPSTNCRHRACQQCAMRPPLYAINAQSNILSLSRCQLCGHTPDHAILCYRYAIHTLHRNINLLLPRSPYAINEQRPSLCRTPSPCALIYNELAANVQSIHHWNAINKLQNVPPAAN